jgi:hypothetical protein
MPTSPLAHHIFIDFENVPSIDLGGLRDSPVKITLLLGEKQKRLETTLVEQLLHHAANVQFVRLLSSGKNALDFTLAYYVGRAAATDANVHFHIISRDKGFDPLIEHLRQGQVKATRHDAFENLPFLTKPASRPSESNRIHDVIIRLNKHSMNRPKRRATLLSHLQDGFQLTDQEAEALVNDLRLRHYIVIDAKGGVTYQLPPTTH